MRAAPIASITLLIFSASTPSHSQDAEWKYIKCDGVETHVENIDGVVRNTTASKTEMYRFMKDRVQILTGKPLSMYTDACGKSDLCQVSDTNISVYRSNKQKIDDDDGNGYNYLEMSINIDRGSGDIEHSGTSDEVWRDTKPSGVGIRNWHVASSFKGACRATPAFAQRF